MIIADKKKLYLLTVILDLFLLYALITNNLCNKDKIFIFIVLTTHLTFFYSLYIENKKILDLLHIMLFLLLLFGIFLENIYLLSICLFLLFIIQALWIYENRCILNEKEYTFGYGKQLSISVLLLTIIYSIKIGLTFNNTKLD
jgi:hypothetical protein